MAEAPVVVGFVLGSPRSGTTWLGAVLGSTGWARGLGEYGRFWRPGSTARCTTCLADGLDDCTHLHGIEAVPAERAFAFAAERLGTRTLVDVTKRTDWAARFLDRPGIDARLIHLVRNPCGVLESSLRRAPDEDPAALLAEWERRNRRTEAFLQASGRPAILACYDDLADDPGHHFPPVCALLGGAWDPAALDYWQVPHHGLGGNGAASLYLRGRARTAVATGDPAFYGDLASRPVAADRRWEERLAPDLVALALANPYGRDLAARLGTDWAPRLAA